MRNAPLRVVAVLSGLLATATGTPAAEVPVAYSVEFRAYKTGVAQGTPLTFEVYSDDGCTNLLQSHVLAAGSAVRQEKILAQRVSGQTPAPPAEMRLHATLTVAGPADPIFLRVTGPGIVPVDTACQPQAARASESVPRLPVRNGNGVVVGHTSTPYATCTGSGCSLAFTRTLGTGIRLDCSITENSMGTTLSCVPVGTQTGFTNLYADATCNTQPVLEWMPPTVYSPANLPANPPPALVANAGLSLSGKVLWSEAPMSSYTSMQVWFPFQTDFGNCIDAGTHLVITPQVFDPMTLSVPPFTVGP